MVMELQKRLLEDGIKHGMCEKFQNILSGDKLSPDELLMLYHKGLDFCIEHNWPSMDMVGEFSDDELHRNGIFYNYTGTIDAKMLNVINEDSDVTVVIPENRVASIYARHNSKVKLIVEPGAFCYVSCYDNASVSVISKAHDAKLKASLYSGHIDSDKFDNVTYK